MSFSFPKSSRLRKRKEFLTVSQRGRTFVGKTIFIQWYKNNFNRMRLGITIPRKFGKAHDRNLFKRLAREAFRLTVPKETNCGLDLHVRLKGVKSVFTFHALLEDYVNFFKNLST